MNKLEIDVEMVILGVVASFLAVFIFIPRDSTLFTQNVHAEAPSSMPVEVPSPTATPAPVFDSSTVDSSDGKLTLIMNKHKSTATTSYEFIVENKADSTQKTIFTTSKNGDENIVLPDNSWSPMSSSLFVKEKTPLTVNYFVLTAAENNSEVNITELFSAHYPDLSIQEVTGWLNDTLLIVNTVKNTGEVGPSYWFNIQNKSFGQLGSHYG